MKRSSPIKDRRAFVLFGLFLAILSASELRAQAATPSFTITATNVTMPTGGKTCTSDGCTYPVGSSVVTLTSVDGYAGTVQIGCTALNPPEGAKLPYCITAGAPSISLSANQTATGGLILTAYPIPASLAHPLRRGYRDRAAGLALVGVLLFGFGFSRRALRWLAVVFFALGTLAGVAGVTSCGGNSSGLTPGTYTYTVTATDMNTGTSVSTSIYVLVP